MRDGFVFAKLYLKNTENTVCATALVQILSSVLLFSINHVNLWLDVTRLITYEN